MRVSVGGGGDKTGKFVVAENLKTVLYNKSSSND